MTHNTISPSAPKPPSTTEVAAWREAALNNGYHLVKVYTKQKNPAANNWQHGHARGNLLNVDENTLNTGVLCGGLRVIDFDIEDHAMVAQLRSLAEAQLGSTIVRTRPNSARLALVYRAAEGEPPKQLITGTCGKIEILGKGQQFVAHGKHPSGADYVWEDNQGPHNTLRGSLPVVSRKQEHVFLTEAAAMIGASAPPTVGAPRAAAGVSMILPGTKAAVAWPANDMSATAQAGLGDHWFDRLSADQKNALLLAITTHPAMIAAADQERGEWLRLLFSFADAEQRGAGDARAIALAWCKTSPRFRSEADFDSDWHSFKTKPGGITIGTLLDAAEKMGFDLNPWRNEDLGATAGAPTNDSAGPAALGAAAGVGAAFPLPRGAPFTQMPHRLTEAHATAHLNARLFKTADWGGAPAFGRFSPDNSVSIVKQGDLPVLLAGHFVEIPDGKGGSKHSPAASWWIQSASKIEYDYVIYDPEDKCARPGEQVLNLWRGFAVQPVKGQWRKMRRHIWQVLCGRDHVAFKYLIRWMAHAVQHPGTNPETMVVLRSDKEGVGKSALAKWLLRIFGAHGREIADTRQVLGEFNDALATTSFVALEEGIVPSNHQAAGALLATLTAHTVRINPKGRAAYDIPHGIHFMMTTNGRWVIPAGAEARRFLMLDVTELMSRAYFDALWVEVDSGGIAAMLHDLCAVDLRSFNPRVVPATTALIEQQRCSADDVTGWITDAVIDGAIVVGAASGGFGQAWPSATLRGQYLQWCTTQGVRRPKSAREFGRALAQLGLGRGAGNNPPMWTVPDRRTLQAAVDRRAGIRRR